MNLVTRTFVALLPLTLASCQALAPTASPAEDAPLEATEPFASVALDAQPTPGPATPAEPAEPLQAEVASFLERVEAARAAARPAPRPVAPIDVADDAPMTPLSSADDAAARPGAVARPATAPASIGASPSAPAPSTPPPPAAPPVLLNVAVRASNSPTFAAPTTPATPTPNGAVDPAVASLNLRALLEQSAAQDDPSFAAQLDARLMWLIAGDDAQARTPLESVSKEQQELAGRIIEAVRAVRSAHMGDLPRGVSDASRELAALQDSLRSLHDLSIPTLRICSAVRGFGQFDPIEPATFAAGATNELVLYCEVRDFVSEKRDDGQYYTTFAMRTAIINRSGETVLELRDEKIEDRSRNRRTDCFVPRLVRLPATLGAGGYVAKVTLEDKLGGKVAESQAAFELAARR